MTPREHIACSLERLDDLRVEAFVRFIREGDPDTPIPCWGGIFERFTEQVNDLDTRMAVWSALIEADDRRPQWLFLHLHRDQPEMLERLLADVEHIPADVQCVLVALEAAALLVEARVMHLCARARQLWRAGEDALYRERQLLDGRIGALMMLRFFVPSSAEAGDERATDLK